MFMPHRGVNYSKLAKLAIFRSRLFYKKRIKGDWSFYILGYIGAQGAAKNAIGSVSQDCISYSSNKGRTFWISEEEKCFPQISSTPDLSPIKT